MDSQNSTDLKHYKARFSMLWESISAVAWGCAAGAILAAFVIVALHLER